MSEITHSNDSLNPSDFGKEPLPSGLNVLTILSIIGCVFAFGAALYGFTSAKKTYETKDEVIKQMQSPDMPAFAKAMMPSQENFEQLATNSYENRVPILILSIVSAALCLYGVLQMRKRKKQGFLFYTIGELLPFAILALFIGSAALSGFAFIMSTFFALLFIILYYFQRKHLVY